MFQTCRSRRGLKSGLVSERGQNSHHFARFIRLRQNILGEFGFGEVIALHNANAAMGFEVIYLFLLFHAFGDQCDGEGLADGFDGFEDVLAAGAFLDGGDEGAVYF